MNTLKFDILSDERRAILSKFLTWKNEFYLAGGTALALQIGHRESIDFDFFSPNSFDVNMMIQKLSAIFGEKSFKTTQIEKNTLSISLNQEIKISFMTYEYKLIEQLLLTDYMSLASIPDIACMKLSAIMQRSALKDYVDLFEIMQKYPLEKLISFSKIKYPTIDSTVILKSLSYLEDITPEPLIYKAYKIQPQIADLKVFFQKEVKRYLSSLI